MWRLWRTARTWRTRPSELIGLTDRWEAFEFDEAVALFGDHVEGRLARVEADAMRGKRDPEAAVRTELHRLLGTGPAAQPRRPRGRPRFRYDLTGGKVAVARNPDGEE